MKATSPTPKSTTFLKLTMSHRIAKLNDRIEAKRALLRWFGVMAAGTVFAAIAVTGKAHAHDADSHASTMQTTEAQAGLMLRPGDWSQDNGSYLLPAALDVNPRNWPTSGWYRVTARSDALQVQPVTAPERGMPDFLREIAVQVMDPAAPTATRGEAEAEAIDTRYIRLPGVQLAQGRVPTVAFSHGVLTPKLDHAYELKLGDAPFTLTVQNGLRNKAGVAYGDGAVYTVTMAGESYSFHVQGGNGWETTVVLAADLDGDHKPDFIVRVGDQEALLMSSHAKPGLNPPAAALAVLSEGC